MEIRELSIVELQPKLNAILVKDSSGLELVRDFFKRVDIFGYDVETNVVNDFTERKVRTIQIGNRDEQYVIDLLHFAGSTGELIKQGQFTAPAWAQPVLETLRGGLESGNHTKVGVNLQFDYEAVKWGFGLRPWQFYDCQIMEKLIYCGVVNFFREGWWAMDDMLARYAGLKLNKTLQTSFDLETELTDEQIAYAALDTRAPLAIRSGQLPVLEKAGLMRVARLENSAIPAFGDMHLNGFYLDKDQWLKNVEENKLKHIENIKLVDKYFFPVVGGKAKPEVDLEAKEKIWRDTTNKETRAQYRKEYMEARKKLSTWDKESVKWEGEAAINYGSNPQLLAALRKMGFGEKKLPNTDDGSLKKLAHEPAIAALREYRETKKMLSTYGAEFAEKYINPNTGRVHSRINQLGADTGRTSSTAPNLQNIPKGSAYRKCFKPRPGYSMVTVDMSGAELRIMAELSGEPSWLDAFEKNWDVHCMCAEMMYGQEWADGADEGCPYMANHQKCECKKGHKKLRNNAKAPNFKLAYGGEDLSENLGVSKGESDKILKAHRTSFPVLHSYLEQSGKSAVMNLCSRTFSGRRRLYEKPSWEKAKELAMERFEEQHKDPLLVTSKEIGRAYNGMFGRIERQGKNTPIQGGNIDIAKVAMGRIWHELEPKYGAFLVNMVHDEVVIEALPERAEEVAQFIVDCIRRAGAEFMKKLTMESDYCIADCWSK